MAAETRSTQDKLTNTGEAKGDQKYPPTVMILTRKYAQAINTLTIIKIALVRIIGDVSKGR
jgi:hypothetical protein